MYRIYIYIYINWAQRSPTATSWFMNLTEMDGISRCIARRWTTLWSKPLRWSRFPTKVPGECRTTGSADRRPETRCCTFRVAYLCSCLYLGGNKNVITMGFDNLFIGVIIQWAWEFIHSIERVFFIKKYSFYCMHNVENTIGLLIGLPSFGLIYFLLI